MHRQVTVTLEQSVYDGLCQRVAPQKISQFIEDLLRPHVLDTVMDESYQAMAADEEREMEALSWSNTTIEDIPDAAW